MKTVLTCLAMLLCLTVSLCTAAGCRPPSAPAGGQPTAPAQEAAQTSQPGPNAELLVAGENIVYGVSGAGLRTAALLRTESPISSVGYAGGRAVVTAYDPADAARFRGFYCRDNDDGSFVPTATPQLAPKFSYLSGDTLFLVSGELTRQQDGDYTRVGLYALKARQSLKEWLIPGKVEDVAGKGGEAWLVTANTPAVSSNLYKIDLQTGTTLRLIPEARRYPLDQVAVDSSGDVYVMISGRVKSEWSNKIYRYMPQQTPYELTSGFVSNTRPNAYALDALGGTLAIVRSDISASRAEIEKPIALLDPATRKQIHLLWEHRPVAVDHTADAFVVLAEDGTLAFVAPDAAEKPGREITVAGLTEAKWLAVNK